MEYQQNFLFDQLYISVKNGILGHWFILWKKAHHFLRSFHDNSLDCGSEEIVIPNISHSLQSDTAWYFVYVQWTAIEPIIRYNWVFCVCASVGAHIHVCFFNWSLPLLGQELHVIYLITLEPPALIQSIWQDFSESLLNE